MMKDRGVSLLLPKDPPGPTPNRPDREGRTDRTATRGAVVFPEKSETCEPFHKPLVRMRQTCL